MNHAHFTTARAVHEKTCVTRLPPQKQRHVIKLSVSRTSPISTSRLSISDKHAEREFPLPLTSFPSGTPRLLGLRHRRRAFLKKKKKKKTPITGDRSFSSGTFPYRQAQHDSERRDRGTKIIIVFPGFPFVCTLRFPVRFFVTPRLNPRRRAETRKGSEEFATKSPQRDLSTSISNPSAASVRLLAETRKYQATSLRLFFISISQTVNQGYHQIDDLRYFRSASLRSRLTSTFVNSWL